MIRPPAEPGALIDQDSSFFLFAAMPTQDLGLVNYSPEPHSVELREIPRATISDDQVLMEVQAIGVCGSDLHMWTAQQSWQVNYPVVLGHEFCGIIREVGRGVTGWKEGDRVVSETAAVIDPTSP